MHVPNKNQVLDKASWACGPLFAILLMAMSIFGNSGPGFFLFALVAAVLFALVAPIVQAGLRRTRKFSRRPIAAAAVSICFVLTPLVLISGMAIFNQW